jgi:hypothetical protein
MKIDIRNDKVVYVTIGNYEYYIDDSTDEQIVTVHTHQDSKSDEVELNTHQKNTLIATFIGHRSVLPYHKDWRYLIEAVKGVEERADIKIPRSFNQDFVYNNIITIIQLVDKNKHLVEKCKKV